MSRFIALSLALAASAASAHPVSAGAFMLPPGNGQFIGSVGYSEGSRRFDPAGRVVSAPSFRKAEAGGYLEYGLEPWLSLVLAPTLSHEHDAPATNSVTGSDASAFGARARLLALPGGVVAVQALIQPPIGATRTLGADLRLQYGQAFWLFGLPAFLDVEPGARIRADTLPTEARLDLAAGVRARPDLLVLLQEFSSWAPRDGTSLSSTSYSKLQGSLVYDLSWTWSVQAGCVRTIAGRNAVRETGPFGALWYRF